MFKKSKRNFRTKREENSDNEEEKKQEEVKASIVKLTLSKENHKIESTTTKNFVLSFINEEVDDDENTQETFKIKKSKESRRLAKEKKSREKRESKNVSVTEIAINDENIVTLNEQDEVILFSNEIKIKPLKLPDAKKSSAMSVAERLKKYSENILNDDDLKELNDHKDIDEDTDDKLKKLREEMETLNGDETYTNEVFRCGHIPDANMIHALKKKRQQAARQVDYIQIDSEITSTKNESRIVREDEHDDSDEERISMNLLEKSTKERQQTRDRFLAYEQGSDDENANNDENRQKDDDENEYELWEKEQIRKGVQMTQIISSKLSGNLSSEVLEKFMGYNLQAEPMDVEQKSEIQLTNLPKISFSSIKENLTKSHTSLTETYRAHLNEKSMIRQNFESSLQAKELIQAKRPDLNARYKFYQEMKSYTIDLIDCFNEKIDEIDKIETKWMNLFKTRAQKMQLRRQEDIKDQNVEYSLNYSQDVIRKTMDPGHQRRFMERELRRKKRREIRLDLKSHNEGLSSDDDESPNDALIFNQKRNDIIKNINEIFKDVHDDYCDINCIKKRFAEWKALYPDTYEEAYISLSLVKLVGPLVRHEILDWNPLEASSQSLESFEWHKSLSSFNDNQLQTRIIEKFVYDQRLAMIIENIYEPFSGKHNKALVELMNKLDIESSNAKKLNKLIITRIQSAIDNDIFIPLFPRHVLDSVNCSSRTFFYSQFWSCVKLFSNILMWNDLLSSKITQELSLDSLLNRYIMASLQCMDVSVETLSKIDYIVKKLPQKWFENDQQETMPQLNNLCRLLRRFCDKFHEDLNDGKMSKKHFTEQIRSIRKVFASIRALNHAIEITNKFEIK